MSNAEQCRKCSTNMRVRGRGYGMVKWIKVTFIKMVWVFMIMQNGNVIKRAYEMESVWLRVAVKLTGLRNIYFKEKGRRACVTAEKKEIYEQRKLETHN